MNLKAILMQLGNCLVTERGYNPAHSRELPNTGPIDVFTRFVNDHAPAQEILADMGIVWPTIKNPHPEEKPVGFWVVDTAGGECIKWGKDGDTEFPYPTEEESLAQAAFVAKTDDDASIYILKVFANGQMVTMDFQPNEHCTECGAVLQPTVEGHPHNTEDKTLYEGKRCPNCEEE